MAHQSLYRRYRPQRFAEIRGQSHVRQALQTAVREGRWSHAYLFSGPRGTGKTSTARVLAKALNCEDLDADGEPCGVCESCVAIEQGRSFDLHELDAASHNKVDDIRDLISKVHLGSPGRTKVYILDEVHMLTAGAENALLKTLEEPPDHVVFVLATTESHKVVPTIRSRTQHFEFQLLPGDELADHVRWVIADAGLDVDDEGVEYVLRSGGGSARDTLSALDLVSAAGGVPVGSSVGVELARAIGAGDSGAALTAVQRALEAGREPRTIAEEALGHLRDAFLASMGAGLSHLSDAQAASARDSGAALTPATLTRALESLGAAVVEMRQSPDPRVPLEVCLLRLTRRIGTDPAALLQRVEALEAEVAALRAAAVAGGPVAASAAQPRPGDTRPDLGTAGSPPDGHPLVVPSPAVATTPGGARPPVAPVEVPGTAAASASRSGPSGAPRRTSPAQDTSSADSSGPSGARSQSSPVPDTASADTPARSGARSPSSPVPDTASADTPGPSSARSPSSSGPDTASADTPGPSGAAPQDGPRSETASVDTSGSAGPAGDRTSPVPRTGAPADPPGSPGSSDAALSGGAEQADGAPPVPPAPAPRRTGRPADAARRTLGGGEGNGSRSGSSPRSRPAEPSVPPTPAARPQGGPRAGRAPRSAPPTAPPAPSVTAAAATAAAAPAAGVGSAGSVEASRAVPGVAPTLEGLEAAWRNAVLEGLSRTAKARYKVGRFLGVDGSSVRFGLPNAIHRDRCSEFRPEVEAALATALGHPLVLVLEVDPAAAEASRSSYGGGAPARDAPGADDDIGDISELTNADDVASSGIERLTRAFPGSKVINADD